ncbi:MAG: glycoside hydrolase [Planctomycetota bacterium]|nr:exo-alpha-sialidase [Planctomycetaceae bacterium]MDQ3329431.1 glycoside hydrolase [Planctomycetota bacterium]
MTQLSRRTVLKTGLAIGTTFVLGRSATAVAAPTVAIESISTISKLPDKYHGWPTLARRKNGELSLVYSGGREHHVCPFGRVELMTSRDGGESWTWPRVLLDSAIDDRDAGVLETAKGTLLVSTFTSLAYEPTLAKLKASDPESFARWNAVHERMTAEERTADLGTWMLRSEDGGASWSGRYRVPVNSPHGPIQLADGRLLYAGVELWTKDRKVGVAESRDDGKTWNWLSDIPTRSGDSHREYHELHAVEAKPGRVVVHIRNHNRANAGETLQCESTDGGRTWSEPRSIGVWGLPSHLLRLNDDRLLMTYGYRRAPFGNQARISDDAGATWSEPFTISDDGAGGDLGYPSTAQLDDGSLVTVWYEQLKGNSHAVLRQARWKLR